MIAKGIIQTIDYAGNTCTVRMPVFENNVNNKEVVVSAVIASQPGLYNGYKENDVVFVAFENNDIDMPVVVGKLFLGVDVENQSPRGALNVENLKSVTPISIPIDTKLTLNNDQKTLSTVGVDGDLSSYKTIADLASHLKKQEEKIGTLNNQIIDDGENLGARLKKVEADNEIQQAEIIANANEIENSVVHIDKNGEQEGMSWHLDTDGWRVYAKDNTGASHEPRELEIVKIDRGGMEISGDLKIKGYTTDSITLFAINDSSSQHPDLFKQVSPTPETESGYYNHYIEFITGKYAWITESNYNDYNITIGTTPCYNLNRYNAVTNPSGWYDEGSSPAWEDGKYIWQWDRDYKYDYDDVNKKWTYIYDETIYNVTGATGGTGEPAVSFWLKTSAPIHTGDLQDANLIIEAYTKIGESGNDHLDPDSYLRYKWDGDSQWTSNWSYGNTIIIPAANVQNADLIVQATHEPKNPDDKTIIYDAETITYSPLNTPVLDLTNDTDSLPYDTSGKIGTGNAISEATVYLNGTEISGAIYTWTLTNCTGNTIDEYNNDNIDDASTLDVDESLVGKKIKITSLLDNTATATCTVSNIGYNGLTLSKDFTITKQWKGDRGTDGQNGRDGYNTATVLLYKRKTVSGSVPTIDWANDLTYTFANKCLDSVPTGWSETIPAPIANDDGLYVTAAVAYNNDGSANIQASEWTPPVLYVQNGEDGDPATSYWLNLSTPIHLGVNQETNITIIPMSQTGDGAETTDSAYIRYYFDGNEAPDWPASASSLVTISPENIINKNIIIEATHNTSRTPYANETITYSSITTPTLDLSRDSGAINYDSEGIKTGSNISTTATVYLGETDYSSAATFKWTVPSGYTQDTDYKVYTDYSNNIVSNDSFGRTIEIINLKNNSDTFTCTAIYTGRNTSGTLQTLKPLYKKEKFKVKDGVKYLLVEDQTKPQWQNVSTGVKTDLDPAEIPQQYITLEKTFTVNKQIRGADGTSIAAAVLYTRAATAPTAPVETTTDYYTYYFADSGSIHAGDIILTGTDSAGWSQSISSGSNPVYESHAAVIVSDSSTSKKITHWSTPAKFVENGANGISIRSQTTYYAMVDPTIVQVKKPDYNSNSHVYGNTSGGSVVDLTTTNPVKGYGWSTTPPEYLDNWNYYTSVLTIYSDDTAGHPHRSFADAIKAQELDGVYALAQGKSTSYYSGNDPAGNDPTSPLYGATMKEGDCWFDTSYHQVAKPLIARNYIGKYIKEDPDDPDSVYILITQQNLNDYITGDDPTNWPDAYTGPTLYEWSIDGHSGDWADVGGEIITNKVTASYINAMDITAKCIEIKDSSNTNTLFKANGLPGTADTDKVQIAGFKVNENTLYSDGNNTPKPGDNDSVFVSRGKASDLDIAGSSLDSQSNNWAFSASDDFGVTTAGKLYARDASIAGEITANKLWINGTPLYASNNTPNYWYNIIIDQVTISTRTDGNQQIVTAEARISLKDILKQSIVTPENVTVSLTFYIDLYKVTPWGNYESSEVIQDTITIPVGSDSTYESFYTNTNALRIGTYDQILSSSFSATPTHIAPANTTGNLTNPIGYFIGADGLYTKTYYLSFKELAWMGQYDNSHWEGNSNYRKQYVFLVDEFWNSADSPVSPRYATAIIDIGSRLLVDDFKKIYSISAQLSLAKALRCGCVNFFGTQATLQVLCRQPYPADTSTFESEDNGLYLIYSRYPWNPNGLTSDPQQDVYNESKVPLNSELFDEANNTHASSDLMVRLSDHLSAPWSSRPVDIANIYYGVEAEFGKRWGHDYDDPAPACGYADGVYITVTGTIKD